MAFLRRTLWSLWLLLMWVAATKSFYLNCPPCEVVQHLCPQVTCGNSSRYFDDCGCCILCGKGDGERCGGRERTSDDCAPGLVCKYRLGNVIREKGEGICEPELCSRKICGYRQRCVVGRIDDESRCVCPDYECAGKWNPVCGNDGNNYNSVCHMQRWECVNNRFVGIRDFGMCPVTHPPPSILTNTVPTEDDLFGQLPTQPAASSPAGCFYMNQAYQRNQFVQADSRDPCRYLSCDAYDILSEVFVPGCGNTPPELDYNVTSPAVHGGWTDWSSWSECVGSCYNGTKTRNRSCTNPPPRNEGRHCDGLVDETTRCVPPICAVHCNYSSWSNWSECSLTCGRGVEVRTRTLTVEAHFAEICTDVQQTRGCRLSKCPRGPCRAKSRNEYLVNDNGCQTVQLTRVKRCEGICEGNSTCCVPTQYEERHVAVSCPWETNYRDSLFHIVAECACQNCTGEQ